MSGPRSGMTMTSMATSLWRKSRAGQHIQFSSIAVLGSLPIGGVHIHGQPV